MMTSLANSGRRILNWIPVLVVILSPVVLFWPAFCGYYFSYGDSSSYFLHLADLYRSAWREGALFWSDQIMSGYPTLGNPQVGLFYIPNLPMLFLDPFEGVRYQIIVHGYLMVIGSYLLSRRYGLDSWISMGLSVLFMSSGTMVSLITMTNNWMAAAWIPWVVLSCWDLESRKGKLWFFLFLHSFLGAGEPQLAFMAYPILVVCLVLHLGWRRALVPVILMVLSGTAQPWLLSFLESVTKSTRQLGIVMMQDLPWMLERALSLSLWAPSSILRSETINGWIEMNGGRLRPNWILSIYIGGVALFWATFGFLTSRTPMRLFLIGSASILAVFSLGTIPYLEISLQTLPIFSMIRYPVRYWILVHVLFFGFTMLGLREFQKSKDFAVMKGFAILCVQGILMAILFWFHPYQDHLAAKSYPVWRTLVESELWLEVILLGLLLLAVLFRNHMRWGVSCVVILAAGIAVHHSRVQIEFSSKSRFDLAAEYQRLGMTEGYWLVNDGNSRSKDSTGSARALSWVDSVKKAWPTKLARTPSKDLFTSSGLQYNGLRSYGIALELIPRVAQGYYAFIVSADGEQLTNLLWLIGVDRLVIALSNSSSRIPVPARSSLERLVRGPYDIAAVWKLPPGLGMVSVTDTVFPDSNYDRLAVWNAHESGALGVTEGVKCTGSGGRSKRGDLDWERIGPGRWSVDTRGVSGLLLLRQAWYPGWRVVVDGEVMDPVSVNLLYNGFCLDGSAERVEFQFRPRFLWASVLLVFSSLFCLLILVIRTRRTVV